MTGRQNSKNEFLHKVIGVIEENLENKKFGVSELAGMIGMSRSNLHRKIKALTGKSPSGLITEVRLSRAKELLKTQGTTVSEVAYEVGFGSATYFSKCFHKHFGFPPREINRRDLSNVENTRLRRLPVPWIIVIIMILLALGILIIYYGAKKTEKNATPLIGVLPFYNDSPWEANA